MVEEPLRQIMSLFNDESNGDAALTLICAVIRAGSPQDEPVEEEDIRRILSDCCTPKQVKFCLNRLKEKQEIKIDDALNVLSDAPEERKKQLLQVLVELACRDGVITDEERSLLSASAAGLGVTCEQLLKEIEDAEAAQLKRNSLLRSGAGILAAIAVLAVFVLTATVVVSVFFGLILAYICLPLEKFYERLFQKNVFCRKIFAGFEAIISFGRSLVRYKHLEASTPEEKAEILAASNRARAVTATITTVVIIIFSVVMLLSNISAKYAYSVGSSMMRGLDTRKQENIETSEEDSGTDENKGSAKLKGDVKEGKVTSLKVVSTVPPEDAAESKKMAQNAIKTTESTAEDVAANTTAGKEAENKGEEESDISKQSRKVDEFLTWIQKKIDEWRPGILKNSYVKMAVDKTAQVLKDPESQKAVGEFLLKRSGGVFSFTAGFFGIVVSFLFNLLMTIFFFSLILSHMAKFTGERDSGEQATSFVVGAILKSPWLPKTSESAIEEASLILGEIIRKLKVWLRGYLSIIAIEEVYFIAVFIILKIPYGLPLGAIAGATLLLPFIGPICSVGLTLLVCLAAGCSMTQIVLVLIAYAIMYGVIEQLILYPSIVGGALGLTRLETIIVVLLGGYFAGIAGMIFAIPTAAVLKYLIPKLYMYRPGDKAHS